MRQGPLPSGSAKATRAHRRSTGRRASRLRRARRLRYGNLDARSRKSHQWQRPPFFLDEREIPAVGEVMQLVEPTLQKKMLQKKIDTGA